MCALLALALVAAACGGSNDEADQPKGDPNHFVIWAPTQLKKPVDRLIARFEKQNPDVTVDAVYETGAELNDRLLVGERPDLYVATTLNIEENIDAGIEFANSVVLGQDRLELIVPPGNPGNVADLSVFGTQPGTKSGICPQEDGCGRAARELLDRVRITPDPDVQAPAQQLITATSTQGLDAALVYRSQAVKAHTAGSIEYVKLPSTQELGVEYRVGVLVPGEAADRFVADIERAPGSIQKIVARAGLGSFEGEPQ
jgi:molybdate transport system substrate-binding protein